MDANNQNTLSPRHPVPWGGTLLGLAPFLLVPVGTLLSLAFSPPLDERYSLAVGVVFSALIAFAPLLVLLIAWLRDFPRWSFPYWGFVLLVTAYFTTFRGTIFGKDFTGDWRVWLPLLGMAILGTLLRRSLQPVVHLLRWLWQDWTLLSFAFYGTLPLLYIGVYDEVHENEIGIFVVHLILAAGALLYMRPPKFWPRFAFLVTGFMASWLAAMVHQGLYWNGRQESWMPAPATWTETVSWMAPFGMALLLFLLTPVLIAALRWIAGAARAHPPV